MKLLFTIFVLLALQDGFARAWRVKTSEEVKKNVVFRLVTRKNEAKPEIVNIFDLAKNKPLKYFDPKKPVRILIHGWRANDTAMSRVRHAYTVTGDYNTITMDWHKVDNPLYPIARLKIPHLGQWLSTLMDHLVDMYGLKVEDFHLIGHSLGAHIAGRAGRAQDGRIGRITALDPAGPLFKGAPDRLTYAMAHFVDVIHTCGNVLGYWDPIGHVDFYPNGGICDQPGCSFLPNPTCSHNRAKDIFAESLISDIGFWSEPYENGPKGDFETNSELALMGQNVDRRTRGVYFLKTAERFPFALSLSDYSKKRNRKL